MRKFLCGLLLQLLLPSGKLLGQGESDVEFKVAKHCADIKLFPERDTLQLEFDYSRNNGILRSNITRDTAPPHQSVFKFLIQQCRQNIVNRVSSTCGQASIEDTMVVLRIPDRVCNRHITLTLYNKLQTVLTKQFVVLPAISPRQPFTKQTPCNCDTVPIHFVLYDSIDLRDGGEILKSAIKKNIIGRRVYLMRAITNLENRNFPCYNVFAVKINFTYKDKNGKNRVNEWLTENKSVWRQICSKRFPPGTNLTFSFKYRRTGLGMPSYLNQPFKRISPGYLAQLRLHKTKITITVQP